MTESTHLLLVDDEDGLRTVTAERLADAGYTVTEASSGEQALEKLERFAFDVVISDLRLPGIDGREVLAEALQRYPGIVAIVVTGYGTVKDAVDAIKRGAADFISKPFLFEELLHVLDSALEQRRLRSENAYLREQLEQRDGLPGVIGQSRVMRSLCEMIEAVAPSGSTVLISGETGTGKEVVARAIHQTSPRRHHRFVALNCSAIPESLLEAELFGHARGAFTGAVATRQGRLEQADHGTLFLDEVGTMSIGLQQKLLRVLQEREFERVGENRTIRVDVRVLAATNSDLAKMVADGTFREDLYYRLNVIPLQLPPLRERTDDVPLLVQHFVRKVLARDADGEVPDVVVSQDAMRRLMAYSWPGNVRQLENAVERALILRGSRPNLDVPDLPPEIQAVPVEAAPVVELPDAGIDLPTVLARIERDLIARALARTRGNRADAARVLGLKRTTLVEKLKRIPDPGAL
ncbi:MAG: sigma-54-dependent transcriptional regulator [Vicinamibacterales bacterium]